MLYKLYKNNFKVFTEYFIIFFLSLHIFFWDTFQFINYKINFFGINLLNFKTTIIIIFCYYLLNNYKFFLTKNKNLILIFGLLLLHLFLNFDHNFFIYKKLSSFFLIFSIFIVCNNYYNFILKSLEKIIFLFLIIISIVLVHDFFDNNFLNNLKNRDINFYLLFSENSHFSIMVIPVIFFLIFNKRGQFSFLSILGLIIAFIAFFLFYSTSLIFGLLLILLFTFVFYFNEVIKRIYIIALLIIVCILSLHFSKYFNINERHVFNDTKITFFKETFFKLKKTLDLKTLVKLKDYSYVPSEYIYDKKCNQPITINNYSNKWKNQNQNIGIFFEANSICLPLIKKKFDLIPNENIDLSVEVFINAGKVSFFAVKDKFYGYGLNNYESAFAKQMISKVVPNHFKEIYYLNYNDASSNFWKLICEFGIFSIFFLFILLKFAMSENISVGDKLFFVSIILMQFLRGTGYSNGGFAFSFAIMFAHLFYNTSALLTFSKKKLK